MLIRYDFHFAEGKDLNFEVDLDRKHSLRSEGHNDWTKLGFHQCGQCPLKTSGHQYCPAAIDVEKIIQEFSSMASCDQALVTVTTPQRRYSKTCPIQVGLGSLMGLAMATSQCPILSSLRGMAHYHLPFSSIEETVTRTVSFYLLKQLFIAREGGNGRFELEDLKGFYQTLQSVNQAFFSRIRAAVELDANLNAIINFSAVSWIVSHNLDAYLDKLKPIMFGEIGEATSEGSNTIAP